MGKKEFSDADGENIMDLAEIFSALLSYSDTYNDREDVKQEISLHILQYGDPANLYRSAAFAYSHVKKKMKDEIPAPIEDMDNEPDDSDFLYDMQVKELTDQL